MTAPTPDEGELAEERPEPVLDYARVASLAVALVVAVLGAVGLAIRGEAHDLSALEYAANAVLTAGAALFGYLAPLWQARKARDRVTPLDDPRDAGGRPLEHVEDAIVGHVELPATEVVDDEPGQHATDRKD